MSESENLKPSAKESAENWLWNTQDIPEKGTHFVGTDELDKALILSTLSHRTSRPLLLLFSTRATARNTIDNLRFLLGPTVGEKIHYLPSLDFDFYRGLLPNPEILSERNATLFHALNDPNGRIFVTTGAALIQKFVPTESFLEATQILEVNQEINREEFIQALIEAGYQRQPNAFDSGVFSVRGGVLDIFCPLYPEPLRIEFFGDLIEEIRFFDPQTQRSLASVSKVFFIPLGQS